MLNPTEFGSGIKPLLRSHTSTVRSIQRANRFNDRHRTEPERATTNERLPVDVWHGRSRTPRRWTVR